MKNLPPTQYTQDGRRYVQNNEEIYYSFYAKNPFSIRSSASSSVRPRVWSFRS